MYSNLTGTTENSFHIGGPRKPAIITGDGTPDDSSDGTNGDIFLSKDQNNIYIKRSGVWFNITDSDLVTIAGLSQGTSNVILSDGTNWTSSSPSNTRTALGLAIGTDVEAHDATILKSASIGVSVQAFDTDLSVLAGLSQGTNNIIQSDGTNWTSVAPSTARTNLGLAIGTNIQAYDSDLTVLAGLSQGTSNFIVSNGTNWTSASPSTVRTDLGLVIGTNIQAWDSDLDDIAALSQGTSSIILSNGTHWTSSTPSNTRTALGLVIGTNVQAWDADLDTLAGLSQGTNNIIQSNGTVWGSVSASTARTNLGLAIGTNVQAWDSDLDDIAALSQGTSNFIVSNGTHWTSASPNTVRTDLGLVIGTNVQAWDSDLDAIAGLAQGSNKIIQSNGTVWQSITNTFDNISDVIITSPSSGHVIYYNGTNWVNAATGVTSGVQAYDADLVTIAGLSQGTSNIILSDGTNWTSSSPSNTRTALGLVVGTNIQAWDADLDTIAGLAQGSNKVIQSNGTVWQAVTNNLDNISDVIITTPSSNQILKYNGTNWVNSTSSSVSALDDLSDVAISGVASGNILYYNGTNFINAAPGATSGVQPYDSDLNTIAGLTATTNNFMVSQSSAWASVTPSIARTALSLDSTSTPTFTSVTAYRPLNTNGTWSGTTATLAIADSNTYIRCTNASALTITVPTNASVAIAVGSEFEIFAKGTGGLIFSVSGITFNPGQTNLATGKFCVLKKVASDEWDAIGPLT